MGANDTQVGGTHYRSPIQHWDYVIANDLDYFQAMITRYVGRWKKKDGLKDLYKARHFLDKYIEELEKKDGDFYDLMVSKYIKEEECTTSK